MSDLYPTKTRLALLHAIANGEVYLSNDGNNYWDLGEGWPGRVNAATAEQERAGWVELADPTEYGTRRWRLTATGRAVLDAHEPQRIASPYDSLAAE